MKQRFKEIAGFDTPEDAVLTSFYADGTIDKVEKGYISVETFNRMVEKEVKRVFTDEFLDELELSIAEQFSEMEEEPKKRRKRKKKRKKSTQ